MGEKNGCKSTLSSPRNPSARSDLERPAVSPEAHFNQSAQRVKKTCIALTAFRPQDSPASSLVLVYPSSIV
jgi:hypothetical protein